MEKLTVVFNIEDREALSALYKAYLDQTLVLGCRPLIIAAGDQVTVPSEIINELLAIDTDLIGNKGLTSLQNRAEKHVAAI